MAKRRWLRMLDIVGAVALVLLLPMLYFGSHNQTSGARVKSAQCGLQRARLVMGVDNYYVDTAVIPETLDHLFSNLDDSALWDGPYADEKDLLDPWKQRFAYSPHSQVGPYDLRLSDPMRPCDYVKP